MSREWSSHKLKTRYTHLRGGGFRSQLWFYIDADTKEQCESIEKAIKISLVGPLPVRITMEMDKAEKSSAIGFGVPNE